MSRAWRTVTYHPSRPRASSGIATAAVDRASSRRQAGAGLLVLHCRLHQGLVLELGPPVFASTLGGAVEHRPEGPHEVDVSHVLAGVARDQEKLAAPEVSD